VLSESTESTRPGELAAHAAETSPRRRAWFWIKRYGAAEIACLLTMLAASIAAAQVTDSPALLAIAAIAGATVGFYGVLVVTVLREQLRVLPRSRGRWARVGRRTVALLTAEFGIAEVVDTFALRPALMIAGVHLVGDPIWGLLVGKAFADVLFYVISAVCYRLTERIGLRIPRQLRRGAPAPA
jgi:hypothetical protein